MDRGPEYGPRQNVEFQKIFAALNIAHAQNNDWTDTLVHHEAFSGILSTKCEPMRLDKKSSKSRCSFDEEDFGAILGSWYAFIDSEVERSRNGKSAACEPTSIVYSEEVFEPLKRIQTLGPATRFRRRGVMWKTITSHMLKHSIESIIHENGSCSQDAKLDLWK
jgi:hypothetical protein